MFTAMLFLTIACISIYTYLMERMRWRSRKWLLAMALRISAIFVLWLLLSPIELQLKLHHQLRPVFHFLVDTSFSMHLCGADEEVREFLAELLRDFKALSKPPVAHIWTFDESLRRITPNELSTIKFNGQRTRLIEGILALAQNIKSSTGERCLIVLTDGQDEFEVERLSAALSAVNWASQRGINWWIIGVGSKAAPNAQVELTPNFSLTFPMSIVPLQCAVRLTSGDSYRGVLTVSFRGKKLLQRQVELNKSRPEASFELNLTPPTGEHQVVAMCSAMSGESITEDNEVVASIKVIGRKLRLLFVAGSPNPEFKFIKRAFEDDDSIELLCLSERDGAGFLAQGSLSKGEQVVRLTIDRAMLGKFDIVIFGNIDAASLPPRAFDELAWYVGEYGGTLLILGGEKSFANAKIGVLERLLPTGASKMKFVEGSFSLMPTDVGLKSAAINMGEGEDAALRFWKSLPKLNCGIALGKPKDGAYVLLRYVGARADSDAALIWHRYGAGRVIVFGPFDTWRWWMDAIRHARQPDEFIKFWRNLARCMTNPLIEGWLTLTAEKTFVEPNELLTVHAARQRGFNLRQPGEIKVVAAHESGTKLTFTLQRHRDAYVGHARLNKAGRWTLKPVQAEGNAVSVTAIPHLKERMHVGRNEASLAAIAKAFKGQLLSIKGAKKLAADFARREIKMEGGRAIKLRSLKWLYFAVLLLLAIEWAMRRFNGLT